MKTNKNLLGYVVFVWAYIFAGLMVFLGIYNIIIIGLDWTTFVAGMGFLGLAYYGWAAMSSLGSYSIRRGYD